MALAHDATSTGGKTSNAATATLTVAHTCTGSNLVLLVAVHQEATVLLATTITGVTYNTVAMTKITGVVNANTTISSDLFYLKAPATGTHNIVATCSSVGVSMSLTGTSLSGADQTNTITNNTTGTNTGTAISSTITSLTNNEWTYDSAICRDASPTPTLIVGTQTQRANFNQLRILSGNSYPTGSGTTAIGNLTSATHAWTISTSLDWTQVMTGIRGDGEQNRSPFVAFLPLIGVG